VAARRLPGCAGSSVFPAPVRPVLGCTSYAGCAVSRAASGRALSVQTWNLVPAIRSLDEALGDAPDPRVHEAFPELAFRAASSTSRTGSRDAPADRPVRDFFGLKSGDLSPKKSP